MKRAYNRRDGFYTGELSLSLEELRRISGMPLKLAKLNSNEFEEISRSTNRLISRSSADERHR